MGPGDWLNVAELESEMVSQKECSVTAIETRKDTLKAKAIMQ